MSEDAAAPAPIPVPIGEPRAGAAPAKHLRPSLLAALAAPVRKLWPRETDLGRIGIAIAVPVLCWVFYTTSSGMVDIMQKEPGDWIGLGGAVIATTAILVMLASTSWSLGADLASLIAMRRMARERVIIKTSITALVFAFVFSISAFFSFTYYYNNIFKLSSKKIVGELQPMELAADIVLPTAKEVAARYDENTAQLEATPGFKSYLDQLEALSETARTADAPLRESIRKSQEARQRVALEAARRAAADLAEAQAASRQLDDAKARIQQLDRGAADLDAIIKAKQGGNPDQATQNVTFRSPSPLYSLLRLRYVFTESSEKVNKYEFPGAMERVQLVPDYRVLPGRDAIFSAMNQPGFDPRKTVLLESLPGFNSSRGIDPGWARVIDSSSDWLTVEAEVTTPSLLFVTDAYSRDWHARPLAGSSQAQYEVMPADYALRATPLAAGHHLIRFEYVPTGLWTGLAISALAWVAWFGLFLLPRCLSPADRETAA